MKQQGSNVTAAKRLNAGEIWRPIVGWEAGYEVSSLGRVRSIERTVISSEAGRGEYVRKYRSRVLKPRLAHGYPMVVLSGDGQRKNLAIHVAVCIAFHGPRPAGRVAAHGDGVRTNCRADNLRWATVAENTADQLRHGTQIRGERAGNAKLTAAQVIEIKLSPNAPRKILAKRFGVSAGAISEIRSGRNWAHIA
jgi:hypothetical protein